MARPSAPDTARQSLLSEAEALHRAGRVDAAEAGYRRLLDSDPDDADGLHGIALVAFQRGRAEEGLALLDRAIAARPGRAQMHANRARLLTALGRHGDAVDSLVRARALAPDVPFVLAQLGEALIRAERLDDAEAVLAEAAALDGGQAAAPLALGNLRYRRRDYAGAAAAYAEAAARAPQAAQIHNNLGNALLECGRHDEAIAAYRAALDRHGTLTATRINLANALRAKGDRAGAAAAYEAVLAVAPEQPQALNGLAVARHQMGRCDEALLLLHRAAAAAPGYAPAAANLARILLEAGEHAEALDHATRAARLAPDDADVWNGLGNALLAFGRHSDAIDAYRRALALRPGFADALNNLGSALDLAGRSEEAVEPLQAAIAGDPDLLRARLNLCEVLIRLGRREEAVAASEDAGARAPERFAPRLYRAIATLPVIQRTSADGAAARADYAERLAALDAGLRLDDAAASGEAEEAIGAVQPFYLAYQGRVDRALQDRYGRMVARIMAARHPRFAVAPPPPGLAEGEAIRVGVLSAFFRHHSVWKLPLGSWMEALPRDRFALFGYHTRTECDAVTERAQALCREFRTAPRSIEGWCETIRADRLHVLLIPEIGMDPVTLRLAALRNAPVQAAAWGHPQTSGLPTVDAFLSSALMEPPDGDAHYTERLVRLPGLSCAPATVGVQPAPLGREALGLPADGVLFWCCQSLFKYLPDDDRLFPAIARAAPMARFVFVGYSRGSAVTDVFRSRLAASFAAAGLDAERHCVILDPLSPERFAAVTRASDVFLDSVGWSGCNSTLEAVAAGLPVVTWPGVTMRARHSAAILRQIGVTETIARDAESYVALAARLALDPDWRRAVAERVAAGSGRVADDRRWLGGLVAFLEDAARAVAAR